jgi:hypothetical protein
LKMAFRYATNNQIENIFVTVRPDELHLVDLLQDYGFVNHGMGRGDLVYVKEHPRVAPPPGQTAPVDYLRKYFPHFSDVGVQKFIVPIQPGYHATLFPDFVMEGELPFASDIGNAMRQAYLSHTQTTHINPGDVLLFYRSNDLKAVTSLGWLRDF